MIIIQLNKQDFEYDVHSLVKAFYPGMEVSVFCGKADETGAELKISFLYEIDRISISLSDADGEVFLQGSRKIDYYASRKETKNRLKSLLYELLHKHTGKTLSWGTLTGIRPTKIPMALLEEGRSNLEIADYMRKTYNTSDEKTALAIRIANKEKQILEDIHYDNGYSLYIGIPFCPSICLYCSFSSSPIHIWKHEVDHYLDALCREIEFAAAAYRDKALDTVYIGGGTPTTLEPLQLNRLLDKMEASFDLSNVKEFTVEAGRPDSITAEKLQVLSRHRITRISINPQTMNEQTLAVIGRKHTVEQTKEAFALARELGFDNINMDLIVGLPGEDRCEVAHTLCEVAALAPDSFTVHSLAIKRAARLNMFKEQYKEMTFTNNQEIMNMAYTYAVKAGMAPYYLYRQKNMAGNLENVGYAKQGKEGIYNILIMEEKQSILALGAGAATKIVKPGVGVIRIENVKDIKSYLERIDEMIERKRQGFEQNGR